MSHSASLAFFRSHGVPHPESCVTALESLPEGVDWLAALDRAASLADALFQWTRLFEDNAELWSQWQARFGQNLPAVVERLTQLFGHSRALGDYVLVDPRRIHERWLFTPLGSETPQSTTRQWIEDTFDSSMKERSSLASPVESLRFAYRQVLLGIATADLVDEDPTAYVDAVGYQMATLVDVAIDRALILARQRHPDASEAIFSVISMGKTGAQELNYISDVDVIYVCADTEEARQGATVLATDLALILSGFAPDCGEEALWAVDTALRPEGKDGALVRSLPSYMTYWKQWAQTWEFQALLKARCTAGDESLAKEFMAAVESFVWTSSGREGFVADARAMRRRVEGSVSPKEAERELKLGRGGLRDVEFSVQMLQLVHGRTDESIRVRPTLSAVTALCQGGYISRAHAEELETHYRFLRTLEHRTQLLRMRRTHVLPSQDQALRIIAHSMGYAHSDELMTHLRQVRARVRDLHEDMFYRPIVEATAALRADSVRLAHDLHNHEGTLDEKGAQARLAAIGFVDTRGALGHIRALCRGASRRAQIQRHLLPVFLGWLAQSVDPDMGLLHFRTLSDHIGDSHWYLRLLRDSSSAAQRLLISLARSKWLATALELRPEAVQWLDDDDQLRPSDRERLRREVTSLVDRRPEADDAALRVRAVRMRELTRSALADATFGVRAVNPSISDTADIALEGALLIAQREDEETHGHLVDMGLFAMGRFGGRESGYASDADIIVAHLPAEGVDERLACDAATRITHQIQRLLGSTATHAGLTVDIDLRPEGRNGVVSRTPDAYAQYYERWADAWERQALLRARPAAGSDRVCDALLEVIDPIRYMTIPTQEEIRSIRLLKARMERERLPRGIDPARHVKLGPGGLSDVEWTVQLLQMCHAHRVSELRTTSTVAAIEAARECGLLDGSQAEALMSAWTLASQIRSANVLLSGRMSGQKIDVLPVDHRGIAHLAKLLGYETGRERELEDDWLRSARLSRKVMEEIFWGE